MTGLSPAQAKFLERFFAEPFASTFYLTGGTALAAYHLRHRVSLDLDLFSPSAEDVTYAARWTVAERDARRLDITSHFAQERFHNFRLLYGAERLRVDYCVDDAVQLPKEIHGVVRVDSVLDILANKLVAVCDFPEPKHFVDLFVGVTVGGVDVTRVLEHARAKRRLDPYHLARALHQGKHARLEGLRLYVDVDREAMARWYEDFRNRILADLGPPG